MEKIQPRIFSGIGNKVSKSMTSEEVIKEAGLDYEVDKFPLRFESNRRLEMPIEDSDNLLETDELGRVELTDFTEVPGKYATARTDTNQPLGIVSDRYSVIQNREVFSFFDAIVGEGKAIYTDAGFFGVGEVVFIVAKLPDTIKVGKDDIEKNLVLTTSHDGSGSIKAFFTPIRICCMNTLVCAVRGATNKVIIKHSRYAKDQLSTAHKVLGIAENTSSKLEVEFNKMTKMKSDNNKLVDIVTRSFLSDSELTEALTKKISRPSIMVEEGIISSSKFNSIKETCTYVKVHETQQTEETKGTLYGVFQGITGYAQNVKKYRNEESKFNSIVSGDMSRVIQKSFDIITMEN